MALAGVAASIGIVNGLLGIVGFGLENFASLEPEGAKVQIKVGLQCPDCNTFDGDISSIDGYDEFNRAIGSSSGGYIASGDVLDATLDQDSPGTQARYLSVTAADDAVCIAWISVKQNDGAERAGGSWTGDIGAGCGQTIYA